MFKNNHRVNRDGSDDERRSRVSGLPEIADGTGQWGLRMRLCVSLWGTTSSC